MNLRRYIAFVLCALYVAATAGAALASVTCKCLGMRQAEALHHGALCCCHDGGHGNSADRSLSGAAHAEGVAGADGSEEMRPSETAGCAVAGACGCLIDCSCDCELHSTEIELYTSSHSDDSEKAVKCIVSELPPSLAAEASAPVSLAFHDGTSLSGPDPLPLEGVGAVAGLRAPPVAA